MEVAREVVVLRSDEGFNKQIQARELLEQIEDQDESRINASPRRNEEYPYLYPFDVGDDHNSSQTFDSYICLSDLKDDLGDSYICLSDLKDELVESPRNSLDNFGVGKEEHDGASKEEKSHSLEEYDERGPRSESHAYIDHRWWFYGYEGNGNGHNNGEQFTVFHPP